jgi:hypothetical protein
MLTKKLIQSTTGPFSSPMLLVKKKDGLWRPCVDYRHLNAIIVHDQFHQPILDELMDMNCHELVAFPLWISTPDSIKSASRMVKN